MSVTSAMYTGVSGLLSNSQAMSVIGNNIANVNTTGFKTARTLFADLLSDSMGNFQVGTGSRVQTSDEVFTQGSMLTSGNVTDLCISGESFFALKAAGSPSPVTTQDAAYLTRAGTFHVDGNLTLVNPDGYQVLDTQGNPIVFTDTFGATLDTFGSDLGTTTVTDITGDLAKVKALADTDATKVDAADAACAALTSAAAGYASSPNAATSSTLAAAISAAYNAIVAANASSATPATLTTAAGTVATLSADAAAAANAWRTSFGSVSSISQDGLITYLGRDGVTENFYNVSGGAGIAATAENAGKVQRIALVTAVDPTELQKAGGTLYKAVPGAGVPHEGFSLAANTPNGTSEKLISNALEGSNTDMASEFVSMITTQRAYSASSRIITTTDQMTQEVLGLIR